MIEFLTAAVAAIIAALLTHRFGRSKDERDQKREAYILFVRAMASLGHEDSNGAKMLSEANLSIIMNGNSKVVEAVDFLMQHNDLAAFEAQKAFADAVLAMRADLGLGEMKNGNALVRGIVFRRPIL